MLVHSKIIYSIYFKMTVIPLVAANGRVLVRHVLLQDEALISSPAGVDSFWEALLKDSDASHAHDSTQSWFQECLQDPNPTPYWDKFIGAGFQIKVL